MERTRKRGSPQTVSFLRERNALRRRVCPSRNSNIFAPKARDGKPVHYGGHRKRRDGNPSPTASVFAPKAQRQIEITALVSLQTANKLCLRFDKEETWSGQGKETVRRLSLFCGSGMLSDVVHRGNPNPNPYMMLIPSSLSDVNFTSMDSRSFVKGVSTQFAGTRKVVCVFVSV